MPQVDSATLDNFNYPWGEQLYCGLDTSITLEVWEELQPNVRAALAREQARRATALPGVNALPSHVIYDFERALQAPAMEMMLRGFKVNERARREAVAVLDIDITRLQRNLDLMAHAVWNRGLNANSSQQLQNFFYECMGIPKIWISQKGVRKLSMNREVLEKLEVYFYAKPIVGTILAIRDLLKQKQVLETEVDPDGRMRTSYNIAGTETGRWSSSGSSEGTGGNLQNITPRLRYVFEADPGWKLCAIDLEQAESREVGWLCGILFDDWSYLDGCYSGDLHTTTCRLIWPDRPWTGDLKTDKALAEENFYRSYSYRDMSKRGGHGSNYLGTPPTMARHLKVSKKLMVDFQGAYFGAFPGIPKWHQWVASEIQTKHSLTTVFGRTREFFGRATDDTTLREAVAFGPQSATGDRMNLILWRLWKYMGDRIRLMAQVHDAVYFLYREDDNEADVISTALSHFDIDIRHHSGRQLIVGGEAKVGWNWGSQEPAYTNKKTGLLVPEKNPNGLMKFKGSDPRKRIPDPSILSTVL